MRPGGARPTNAMSATSTYLDATGILLTFAREAPADGDGAR
jgi:hypothetical protein